MGGSETRAPCLPVVEYTSAEQAHAADEVEALPEGAVVVRMLSDYAMLRDQVRTCHDGGARTAAVRSPRLKLTARRDRRMTARPRTTTLEIDEELHEFLALMVNDAGPYQSVSAYVEDLIRRNRASQEAAAFTQMQAELAAGFGASESTYQLSSAAEVIARNRI